MPNMMDNELNNALMSGGRCKIILHGGKWHEKYRSPNMPSMWQSLFEVNDDLSNTLFPVRSPIHFQGSIFPHENLIF